MEQIEHGIALVGIVFVTVRRIDSQTAVDAQQFAVVPAERDCAAMICLEIVLRALTTYHQRAEIACIIALQEVILRVVHRNSVDDKVIGINLWLWCSNGRFPHSVRLLCHALTASAPVALQRHFLSQRSIDTESDRVSLDFRRHHLLTASASEAILNLATQQGYFCNYCKEETLNYFHLL